MIEKLTHIKTKSIWFLILLFIILGVGFYYWHYDNKISLMGFSLIPKANSDQEKITVLQNTAQQLQTQQASLTSKIQALNTASVPSILSDAIYLLQQAEYQLTIQQNRPAALDLLALAERRVTMVNSIQFDRLYKAIDQDIVAINAVNALSLSDLINRFSQINTQISNLSISSSVVAPVVNAPASHDISKNSDWRQQLLANLKSLRDIVVVQRTDNLYTPILSAQELSSFKQYLQSIFQQALSFALKNNTAAYQASLNSALIAINQKSLQPTTATHDIKQEIIALQSLNVAPFSHVTLTALPFAINLQQSKNAGVQ